MNEDIIISYIKEKVGSIVSLLKPYTVNEAGSKLFKRHISYRVESQIDRFLNGNKENRWILIPGLRGTGKTTLLAQVYFYLINEKEIDSSYVLYFSLDEITKLLKSDLYEVINAYEKYIGATLNSRKNKFFFLIDEAHYDPRWAIALKNLFDKNQNVFIISTGSSALGLHNSDVARRAQIERMFPLSFIEYNMLKNKVFPKLSLKEKIEGILFNSKDIQTALNGLSKLRNEVEDYWRKTNDNEIIKYITTGSLPFTLYLKEEEIYQRTNNILNRIIYEDISNLKEFDRDTLNKVWNLLLILATSQHQINMESLSKSINKAKPTLNSLLQTLTKAELIFPIKAYGAAMKQVRKTPKYTFIASLFKSTLLKEVGNFLPSEDMYGRLFEDVTALYLYKLQKIKRLIDIKYDSEEGGADFIITNPHDNSRIVLEVGYGSKNSRQVIKTMKKVKAKYGVVVSETSLGLKDNILYLPKKWFLLL